MYQAANLVAIGTIDRQVVGVAQAAQDLGDEMDHQRDR
jgi:hypothetical protein